MSVRYRSARYEILVENPAGAGGSIEFAQLDGVVITERPLSLRLLDDGCTHNVHVTLG